MIWAYVYRILDKLYYRKWLTFGVRYGGNGEPGA
jgi:hypothetical protein